MRRSSWLLVSGFVAACGKASDKGSEAPGDTTTAVSAATPAAGGLDALVGVETR